MALATLSVDLEARLASFERDFAKASRVAEDNAKRIKSAYGDVGRTFEQLGATIAGAIGVNFTVSLVKSAIDAQDKLKDLSKSTALTVETLAGLSSLANKSGTDIDGLAASINKLSVNMGKDSAKFAQLGITAKDPIEAFKQLADVYNAIEDPQKRAAFAAEALGKSWQSAAPTLSEGGQAIGELVARGQKLAGITKESADRADELNDKLAELKEAASGAATNFTNSLVPAMTDITEWMIRAQKEGGLLAAVLVGVGMASAKLAGVEINPMRRAESEVNGLFQQLAREKTELENLTNLRSGQGSILGSLTDRDIRIKEELILSLEKRMKSAIKTRDQLLVAATPVETKAPSEKSVSDFIGGSKSAGKTDPHANDYSSLIRSLNEKIAVQTEDLQSVEQLTQAQKDYAKFQADIVSGAIVLTAAQKQVAGSFWEVYLARSKQNELDKANEKAGVLVEDYRRGNGIILERIAREQELALMTDRQRVIAEALYRVEDDGRAIRERIIRDIQDETAQTLALSKAAEELAAQKTRVSEATAASFDQQRTFEFGWQKAFQSYSDNATNAAKNAEDIFRSATDSMADAMTRFATGQKVSFADIGRSFLSMIVRMQMQAAASGLMGYLSNAFGFGSTAPTGLKTLGSYVKDSFAMGGVFANSPSLSAYSGKVYDSPQPFLFASGAGIFGEAGPEAVMPLRRGRDGKLGVASDGGAISVVINNNGTPQTVTGQREEVDSRGRRSLVLDMSDAMAGEAQRSGSRLNRALSAPRMISR